MDKIYNFKKELYDLMSKAFSEDKKSVKTKLFIDYYKKIQNSNDLDSLNVVFKKLQAEINSLTTEYNKDLETYNKTKDKNLYNKLVQIKDIYSALIEIHQTFKKHLSTIEKGKNGKLELDYESRSYFALSKKIMELKNECFKLEYNDLKAQELRKVIYDLCIEREKMVNGVLGYEGVNLLHLVESKEDRILSIKDEHDDWVLLSDNFEDMKEPGTLTTPEYVNYLRQTFRELSGVEFDIESTMEGIRKKRNSKIVSVNKLRAEEYRNIVRKNFYNLIGSVNSPVISSIANDLLSYLGIYNIEGGYSLFKKHYPNGKIGNEAISQNLYKQGVENIKKMIDDIVKLAQKEINKQGGEITISNHVKTKKDGIKEIDMMNIDIINKMLLKKNNMRR